MNEVHVPFGDNQADTATLLLAAVEELDDFEPGVVKVDHFAGGFTVPEEVAKQAGLQFTDPDGDFNAEVAEAQKLVDAGETLPSQSVTSEPAEVEAQAKAQEEAKPPVKKAPAKKAAAKRAPAKKAAAKKTASKGK